MKGVTKVKIRNSVFSILMLGLAFTSSAFAAEGAAATTSSSSGTIAWLVAVISSVMALGFAIYFYKKMMSAPPGTERMIEIAKYVREGAYAYLFRQYSVVAISFCYTGSNFCFPCI